MQKGWKMSSFSEVLRVGGKSITELILNWEGLRDQPAQCHCIDEDTESRVVAASRHTVLDRMTSRITS